MHMYIYIYMLWINYSEEPIKQYKNPIPQVETQMIHFHEQPKNGFWKCVVKPSTIINIWVNKKHVTSSKDLGKL